MNVIFEGIAISDWLNLSHTPRLGTWQNAKRTEVQIPTTSLFLRQNAASTNLRKATQTFICVILNTLLALTIQYILSIMGVCDAEEAFAY